MSVINTKVHQFDRYKLYFLHVVNAEIAMLLVINIAAQQYVHLSGKIVFFLRIKCKNYSIVLHITAFFH